jgi:hypothetical protein
MQTNYMRHSIVIQSKIWEQHTAVFPQIPLQCTDLLTSFMAWTALKLSTLISST